MYLVRNGATFTMHPTRQLAEGSITMHGGELFIKVENRPAEALELLYALCASLIQQSGLNPMLLALDIPKLDGSTEQVSALTVMNQAREWIDAHEEAPEVKH